MDGITVYDLDCIPWADLYPVNRLGEDVEAIAKTWGWAFFRSWPYCIPRVGPQDMHIPNAREAERQAYHKDQAGFCPYCGRRMVLFDLAEHPLAATYDHIQATSRGGDDTHRNKVLACRECNGKKGSKSLLVFLLEQSQAVARTLPAAG